MKEESAIMFYECSSCKRNIMNNSSMWANKEKRICVCCECFGHGEEKTDLLLCRRENCKLYKYRDHDYITDVPENAIPLPAATEEEKFAAIDDYDEKSNKCYSCNKELVYEYFYVHGKFSLFSGGKFEDPESKAKIKAKFCRSCFDKAFAKLRLIFT